MRTKILVVLIVLGVAVAADAMPQIGIAGLDEGQAWTCIETEFFDAADTTWGFAKWTYSTTLSNFNTPDPRENNVWNGSTYETDGTGVVNYNVYLPAAMDSTTRIYLRHGAGSSGYDRTGYVDIDSTQVAEYTLQLTGDAYGAPPTLWLDEAIGAVSAGSHELDLMRGVDVSAFTDCFYIVEGEMTLGAYNYHHSTDAPWFAEYSGEKKKLFDPPIPVGDYEINAASVTPTITITGATSYNCYLNGVAYTPGTAITELGDYALEVYAFELGSTDHVFSHSGVNFTLVPEPATVCLLGLGLTMLRKKKG
ncbi:MAG: PEP-CTERM sorting domain-containing protein [Dehalococcoidia bacterium]|nr:PEP-CTERM sorting domain-containing protein [Dehalococcoidia bacterium]